MKLFEKLKDLTLIFKVISWFKSHKDGISNSINSLTKEVTNLKNDFTELKTTITGNKESNN